MASRRSAALFVLFLVISAFYGIYPRWEIVFTVPLLFVAFALTTGMTLEAWVRPTSLGKFWRPVVVKAPSGAARPTALAA